MGPCRDGGAIAPVVWMNVPDMRQEIDEAAETCTLEVNCNLVTVVSLVGR